MIPLAPLARIAWSQARRRPLQSGLLVLGVALGVAVFVAVELANQSAMAAFRLSQETVAGRATHRIVGDGRRLDEALYVRLRGSLGLVLGAPVVQGEARIDRPGGESLTLLGVDPFAEAPFRTLLGPDDTTPGDDLLAALLTEPDAVLLGQDLADRLGLAPGDRLPLDAEGRRVNARVVALLRPTDALSRRALQGLLLTDLATAQAFLGRRGRLDRIDLILPAEGPALAARLAAITALLPPGAVVEPAGSGEGSMAAMTASFRLNLRALSLLALLVGVFLIFNTLRFSVVQRRSTLAILRALGVTRGQLQAMLLLEALLLGAVGTAAGLALGLILGRWAVALVSGPINDLYMTVTVRQVEVPAATLVWGALAGLGASLIGALLPALEATRIPPVTALRRSEQEAASRASAPRLAALGIAVALAGLGALAWPGQGVVAGFVGMACFLLAFALWVPLGLLALMRLLARPCALLLGPVGRLAPRGIARSLSRTAVATAALMVAVCVSIGVDVMVGSFRRTVEIWLGQTLQADIFVTPAGITATRSGRTLDPRLAEALAGLPGVAEVATARDVALRSPQLGTVDVVALSRDIAGADRPYLVAPPGGAAAVWRAVEDGAVAISEPFARRHSLGMGDRLTLSTDDGPQGFPIAGVFYDYGSERGVVFMADGVYRRHWRDAAVGSIALMLAQDEDAEGFASELRQALADATDPDPDPGSPSSGVAIRRLRIPSGSLEPGLRLAVLSNRGLRRDVLAVFDRAFAVTGALRLLALVVAFIGVLSTLLSLQLSRARELATLRAMGLTQGQMTALSLLETSLMGLAAGLFSWPTGLALALLLIRVVNRRSFGWTIQPQVNAAPFLTALALALGAALVAGLWSALALRRLPIARVLREE
ncbi:MAG TPA: FtsX-like permease family protein [Anaerolineae bacterium]|nr:FtsX-like permease family protein [Anaerolineae bacterium]